MLPYFLILALPSVLSIFSRRRVNPVLMLLVGLLFVLFMGLRFEVGMDWGNYIAIHEIVADSPFYAVFLDTEPASYALFWVSKYLNNDTLFTNIVAAVLLIVGVFSFAKRTLNPWLAVVSAAPYLIIVFGMTGIRQAMAVGIMLFFLARLERSGFVKQGLWVLVASLFHTSALINFVMLIMQTRRHLVVKLIGIAALSSAGFFLSSSLLFYSDNIAFYQDAYLSDEDSIVSPGALMHVALVWIPAVGYFVFKRRLDPYLHNVALMNFGAWATLVVLVLYFVSSTAASRLTLYLYFVPMMFYPAAVQLLGPARRQVLIFLVVVAHFALLAIWLVYANNSAAHIPYRNLLLEN